MLNIYEKKTQNLKVDHHSKNSNSQNNQYRKNYSRSNSNRTKYSFDKSSFHLNWRNRYYSKTPHIIEIEVTPTIKTEIIQMIETINIKITHHEIIQIIDQTIKDRIKKFITKDHVTFHRTEIPTIKTDREIIPKYHIGKTQVIKIRSNTIGVVHLNIKDK